MDIPLKKMLKLLDAEQSVEIRRAVLIVLAEVGGKDATLLQAVQSRLDDDDAGVRLVAIEAVGKLKIDKAMPALLERIKAGGEEAELAADAVAHLGAKGTKALKEMMPKVAPGLRRYIASALGQGGTSSAESAAVEVLLDSDSAVVEAAVRSLVTQVPSLSASHRKEMTDHLLAILADKKRKLSASSEAAVVRLLAALADPRVEAVLWQSLAREHPAEIRATALQALGKWLGSPKKDQLHQLFVCALDRDFRVAAPALVLLQKVNVTERSAKEWLTLLDAPDPAVRRFAMEKVGDRSSSEVVAGLLRQLNHPDQKLRDQAIDLLSQHANGRKALTQTLLETVAIDNTWFLARALASYLVGDKSDWRDDVFKRACEYQETQDRRADALWFLLRQTNAEDMRTLVKKKALALRKKKAYETAVQYLKLLVSDPSAGFDVRVELACCGLKTTTHDLSADARAGDPSLMQLTRLCQSYEAELLDYIEKAKWLEPDDLYYAGFHLSEQPTPMKQVGAKVLHLVAKRTPRSKIGQAAKRKLKSEALT